MLYDAEPAAGDTEGQALLARFKGRRLPMVDRVEISIIEEEQPRWLSFVNGEADVAYRVGYQFAPQAMPNGKVAPNLAKKGIRGYPVVEAASNFFLFNLDDPVIGGYTPAQVALRRAISLGIDSKKIIDYAYMGLGAVAQGPTLPHTSAYDPQLKTELGDYDPARARALLDLYGFLDKDGDGWRERPDGSALVLRISTQTQARDRKISEVLNNCMKVLGIRIQLAIAQWPENLKAARSGSYQVWSVGGSSASARFGRRVPEVRQPADRRPEHGARAPAGARQALRPPAAAARRPRAAGGFSRGGAHRHRLHALQVHDQPPLARHDAKARRRLPATRVLAGLVAVRRHRRTRRRRRQEGLTA